MQLQPSQVVLLQIDCEIKSCLRMVLQGAWDCKRASIGLPPSKHRGNAVTPCCHAAAEPGHLDRRRLLIFLYEPAEMRCGCGANTDIDRDLRHRGTARLWENHEHPRNQGSTRNADFTRSKSRLCISASRSYGIPVSKPVDPRTLTPCQFIHTPWAFSVRL